MNKEKEQKVSLLRHVGKNFVIDTVVCLNCLEVVLVSTLSRTGGRCPHCNQKLRVIGVAE